MTAVSVTHAIRVLSIDDHPLLREGIATIVGAQEDMRLVGQAATAREGIREYHEKKPDITLMDVRLPDMNGIDALMAIRSDAPNARIIMLSMFRGDVEIRRALTAGARGFLLKTVPPAQIIDSIRRVHAGKKCIPPRSHQNSPTISPTTCSRRVKSKRWASSRPATATARSAKSYRSPRTRSRSTSSTSWRSWVPPTEPKPS